MIIKNFRTIGSSPVEIDLNDIAVLVGANNVGKSSILRAYEAAMSTGSNDGKIFKIKEEHREQICCLNTLMKTHPIYRNS